jgi:hypothetical protein
VVELNSRRDDQRLANLRAALTFLRLPPTQPELQLLHRTFDNWHGLGLMTVGVERQGMRLSTVVVAHRGGRVAGDLHGKREVGTARVRRGGDAVGRRAAGGTGGAVEMTLSLGAARV